MTALNDPGLVATLQALAKVMQDARDDWWIIGSAAVALHLCEKDLGGDPGKVADVDVVTSRRDLDALYEALPLTDTPQEGKPMFLSERFGRWSEPSLDVEFMTGLKLRVGDEWEPVEPSTRVPALIGEHALFMPDKRELIEILTRFGREKDLRRAETLRFE